MTRYLVKSGDGYLVWVEDGVPLLSYRNDPRVRWYGNIRFAEWACRRLHKLGYGAVIEPVYEEGAETAPYIRVLSTECTSQ